MTHVQRSSACARSMLMVVMLPILLVVSAVAAAEEVVLTAVGDPFSDERVDAALRRAVDWAPVIGSLGYAPGSSAVVSVGGNRSEESGTAFDPEAAPRLLAEAGDPEDVGGPLFHVADNAELARLVATYLQRAGFAAEPIAVGTPGDVALRLQQAQAGGDTAFGLSLSTAAAQTVVQNYIGMTAIGAQISASPRGLSILLAGRELSAQPPGTVVRQSPEPGAPIPASRQVSVWVSIGPEETLPDLRGLSPAQAQQRFAALDLSIRVVGQLQSPEAPGTIVQQTPIPGSRLPDDRGVDVWLALRLVPLVPDLRGLQPAQATQRNVALNLSLEVVGDETSDQPAGTIARQVPQPGAELPANRKIRVWRSRGPAAPSQVPGVIGLSRDEAADRLAGARLELRVAGEEASPRAPGTVVRQDPSAGADPPEDGRVRVWLAVRRPAPRVPNLRGLTPEQAGQAFADLKLSLSVVGEEPSRAGAGTVVRQDPAPGSRLSDDRRVGVWLSTGPGADAPDLRGLTPEQATEQFADLELSVDVAGQEHSRRKQGTVARQDPAPGDPLADGRQITVWLSKGPAPRLPDLTGLTPQQAEQEFGELRLVVEEAGREHARAARGTIIGQSPPAGMLLSDDRRVSVILSRGPIITVPDLRGLSLATAAREFSDIELVIEVVAEENAPALAGTIIDHEPPPGSPMPEDRLVAAVVSLGPASAVPDLDGLTRDEAAGRLARQQLELALGGEEDSEARAGTVVRQMPAAGAIAPQDGVVQVWLSRGPPPTVPDLLGLTPEEAEQEFGDLQLAVEVRGAEIGSGPAGAILRQSPEAGVPLPPDRRIGVWLVAQPRSVPEMWKYVGWGAAGLLILGLLVLIERRMRRPRAEVAEAAADTAVQALAPPRIVAFRDPGAQVIEPRSGLVSGSGIGLRARPDAGAQDRAPNREQDKE